MSLEKREIQDASINAQFAKLSAEFGYDYTEWDDLVIALQSKWQTDGFVEIYSSHETREYGRIKDSSLATGASPWYIGLYHARLEMDNSNDPLVVVKFHEQEDGEIVDMKLMLDHDDMFGDKTEKRDTERMKAIRKRIDELVNSTTVEVKLKTL
ncbi:hypothetical protein [Photobacterium phosphoreum]|uniref:hypothetical protein n=1 Tax=Photobacterium phosphoreum TaxID=659 RepID=UPI0007F8ADDE|nr:hypothetical protein [Photobacterium phosphoreum]OBU30477.1 hypothetical protein AYY24_06485 [Photobacterium phosphoreum]